MNDMDQRGRAEAHLAEQLLQGGVGLRYVRRTLRELRDHRKDLAEKLLAQGHDQLAADQEAQQLLGDPALLVAQMTSRPELRSRVRRFAWLLFVLGPLPLTTAAAFLVMFALLVGATAFRGAGLSPEQQSALEMFTVRAVFQWIAPLVAGLVLSRMAARRWIPVIWPLCAIGMVSLVSGATVYQITGETTTLALAPYPVAPYRVLCLFAGLGAAYLLFRTRWAHACSSHTVRRTPC